MIQEKKSWSQFNQAVCGLRFFYSVTCKRDWVVTGSGPSQPEQARNAAHYDCGRFISFRKDLRRVDSSVAGATTSKRRSLIDAGCCDPRWYRFRHRLRHRSQPKRQRNRKRSNHAFRCVRNASRRWIWNHRNNGPVGACYSPAPSMQTGENGWDRDDGNAKAETSHLFNKVAPPFQASPIAS